MRKLFETERYINLIISLKRIILLIAQSQPMPHQQVFEGCICGYDTKIVLNSDGIVIFLWNSHRRRCYEAKLLYQYQGKSKEIQDVFTNLDEFYIYITQFSQDRQRVNINQSGRIQITYHLNKSKNKNPPIIYIDTEVLLAGHQIKTEKKIYNQISDIKRQNIRLQSRIQQLHQLNQENKKNLQELKNMLAKEQARQQSDSSDEQQEGKLKKKKKKYSVISGGKSGVKQLNNTIQQLSKQIHVFKEKMDKQQSKLIPKARPSLTKYLDPLDEKAIFGQKMTITVDENNRYLYQEFKVEGNLITKIKDYGRYQILSKEVIPPIGRHYFVMYIEHISFKIFSLGIVNQTRRNYKNSHQSPQLISYFAKTGAIWQNGTYRGGGPQIPNGVQIRIVVDMNKYSVTWYMDKRQIASTVMKEHLRRQRLVAYLEFNYQGDKIYWNDRG